MEDAPRQSAQPQAKTIPDRVSQVLAALKLRLRAVLGRWWRNPLLHHARRLKPLLWTIVRRVLWITMAALAALALLAWIAQVRVLGAALIVISLAGVALPVVTAPVASADRVARQLRRERQDPRQLQGLEGVEVAWGLALVTLWGLRWMIVVALALTPALVIGVLRLEVSDYSAWRDAARALGDAAAAGRSLLPPGGHIPLFRIAVRALSGGLLAWALLPLASVGGVTAALLVEDVSLSSLAALIGQVVVMGLLAALWSLLTRLALLAGPYELIRALLVVGLFGGLGYAAHRLTAFNAALLARQQVDNPAGDGNAAA